MSDIQSINYDGIEEYDLASYCEESYLNYALYVINDRVLPFIGDGLKPVQRRIIYTMQIEGINTSNKKKKSAYTVGQVLGRFHPHGDSACYEAMVLMTQNFSYNQPLICGQGNFGDEFNPKGFAAMRYTESYLSNYAQSLLSELNSGNVEWQSNYNGDEQEPNYLPARVPNILINGTTGIAVGMATDIPPHNLNEIIDATCALIDDDSLTIRDLLNYIKGPDYPSKADIINSDAEILEIYSTGRGAFRQRATWVQEKDQIIVTSLPYQSAPNLIPKIAELIQSKKIINLEDVRDDSTDTESRLLLQLKSSRVDGQALMNQLFVNTELEKSYRVNLNMIGINGKPQVKDLKSILLEWIEFRYEITRRKFIARLNKLADELNRVQGFLTAFKFLDLVIEIVRNDPDPKSQLMAKLGLNEKQAIAILDLRVRNLAKLEEEQLVRQEKAFTKEKLDLESLLNSKVKFKNFVKKELIECKKEFGTPRISKVEYKEPITVIEPSEVLPNEPVFIVLSKQGWIRCGKGHDFNLDNLSYRNGDEYLTHAVGFMNELIHFIDQGGRSYSIYPNILPSLRGYGEPITNYIKLKDNVKIISLITNVSEDNYLLLASSSGHGHLTKISDVISSKKGKTIFSLKDSAELLQPVVLPNDFSITNAENGVHQITCISLEGRVLTFEAKDCPYRASGMGVKLIDINKEEFKTESDKLLKVFITNKTSSLRFKNSGRVSTIDATKLRSTKTDKGNKGRPVIKGLSDKSIITLIN